MSGTPSRAGVALARFAVVLIVGLVIAGVVTYGVSGETWGRVWRDILDRTGGPMAFRFILQPAMAAVAAVHDGVRDASLGRSPYFWTALHDPKEFKPRLREGLLSTARIILLGLGIDAVYQLRVLKTFYPGEAVLMAILLAVFPYMLLRGPVARLARWKSRRSVSPGLEEGRLR